MFGHESHRTREKHNILQHSSCPDGYPWIENLLEGGYNCIENECYLDEDGQMYFLQDFEDAFLDHRALQREALQDMQDRDRERRLQIFWMTVGANFASTIDRGSRVLVSKARPDRPRLIVSRTEQEEKDKKSFLGRLFGKKYKSEQDERPESSRHRSRHTGIEPDGAWTPLPPYQSRENLSLERKSSRHESFSRHEISRKDPLRHSSSRNESSSRPPTHTSKAPSRRPSIANNQEPSNQIGNLPIRSKSSSRRRHPSSSSTHASTQPPPPPPPLPATSSRHPTKPLKNHSISPPPLPSTSSSRHPSKASATPSHQEELTSWEQRQKAQTVKSAAKTMGTVKTEMYKMGDMARTFVEGQH